VHQCSEQTIKVDKDVLNYRSLYVLGLHNEKVIFLPESMDDPDHPGQKCPPQDPTKFKKDDATTLSPNFPAAELSLLETQLKTKAWEDIKLTFNFSRNYEQELNVSVLAMH